MKYRNHCIRCGHEHTGSGIGIDKGQCIPYKAKDRIKKEKTMKTKNKHPYRIGKDYLIQTVTFFYVGTLKKVTKNELVIDNSSLIADLGRYSDALKNGVDSVSEIEFSGSENILNRNAIISVVRWNNSLPTSTK